MLRSITAVTAAFALVACDSEGIDRATINNDPPLTVIQSGSNESATIVNGSDVTTDSDADGNETTDIGGGLDTGNTGIEPSTTDVTVPEGSATGQCANDQAISDDAGSSTSDGGQAISDDAGSSTSDGGLVFNDQTGCSTSDDAQGAQSTEAVMSNDSPAEIPVESPVETPAETPDNDDNRETDGGSFAADTGGNVLRTSSLTAPSMVEICTTLADPNDFSDTRAGDFILHNNAWRTFRAAPGFDWEQCIFTNTNGALVGWNYDWGPGVAGLFGNPNPSGDFFVRSYPELIYGTKDEFRTSAPTSVTGLPVRLGEMPTFRIDYAFDAPQFGEAREVDASNNSRFPNGTTISGERNVAVESFFYEEDAAGNCTPTIVTRNGGSNHTYEVMIWLDAGAERLPAGPDDFVVDLTIRGEAYKVYTKDSDPRYIAFVAQNPQSTGTIFMNDYIDWARENAHLVDERFGARSPSVQIQDDWCMANILVGTEIFWGAGSFNLTEWTITQSQ